MSPHAPPSGLAIGSLLGIRKKKGKKRTGRRDSDSPPLRTLKVDCVEEGSPQEKLDIIEFAKSSGNRAAGREFNVAESSIREWRKNEHRIRAMFECDPDSASRTPLPKEVPKLKPNGHVAHKEQEEVLVQVSLGLQSTVPQPTSNGVKEEGGVGEKVPLPSPCLVVAPLSQPTASSHRRKPKNPQKLIVAT